MRRRQVFLGAGAVGAAAVAWALLAGDGAESANDASAVAAPGAAGLVTRIDPATGQPIAPTSADQAAAISDALGEAVSSSAEGLVEEPSPVPGGGVMVDLQGRFQNAAVAVADSDSVGAVCLPGGPGGADSIAGREGRAQ